MRLMPYAVPLCCVACVPCTAQIQDMPARADVDGLRLRDTPALIHRLMLWQRSSQPLGQDWRGRCHGQCLAYCITAFPVVDRMQGALEAIDQNETPAAAGVLKLNVREAWDTLRMRIQEVESSADIEGSDLAAAEASQLVTEVAVAFDFPQM